MNLVNNFNTSKTNFDNIKLGCKQLNKDLEDIKDDIYERFLKIESQPYEIVKVDEISNNVRNLRIREVTDNLMPIKKEYNEIMCLHKQMKDDILNMICERSFIKRYTFVVKPPTQKKKVTCISCQSNIEERSYLCGDGTWFFHINEMCLSGDNNLSQKICQVNKLITTEELDQILECGFFKNKIVGIQKVESNLADNNNKKNTESTNVQKPLKVDKKLNASNDFVYNPTPPSDERNKTDRNDNYIGTFQYNLRKPNQIVHCFTCKQKICDPYYLWNTKLRKLFHIKKSCLATDGKPFTTRQIKMAKCCIFNLIQTSEELAVLIDAGFFYRNFIGNKPKQSPKKPYQQTNEKYQPVWVDKKPTFNKNNVKNVSNSFDDTKNEVNTRFNRQNRDIQVNCNRPYPIDSPRSSGANFNNANDIQQAARNLPVSDGRSHRLNLVKPTSGHTYLDQNSSQEKYQSIKPQKILSSPNANFVPRLSNNDDVCRTDDNLRYRQNDATIKTDNNNRINDANKMFMTEPHRIGGIYQTTLLSADHDDFKFSRNSLSTQSLHSSSSTHKTSIQPSKSKDKCVIS